MKKLYMGLLIIFTIFISGCSEKVRYMYIQPTYPIITNIQKVPDVNASLKGKCLWLKGHNTNLCKEDLKVILNLIADLRTNEDVCIKNINNYNDFVTKKAKNNVKESVNP